MKPIILTCALIVYTTLLCAQTDKTPKATVHIKKIEKINGVEKVTDTTYTSDDVSGLTAGQDRVNVREWVDKDGNKKKVVIISNGAMKDKDRETLMNGAENIPLPPDPKEMVIEVPPVSGLEDGMIINIDGEMTPEEEKAWAEKMKTSVILDAEKGENIEGKTLMIKKVRCGASQGEMDSTHEVIAVTVIRNVNISDASAADLQQLGRMATATDSKLSVEKMDFYPNPNNGRFTLSFTLPDKGDTEVRVLDMKGQVVFGETLPGFSGSYVKDIDITKSLKGMYFVRVEQGKHALIKKVVVD